MEINRYDHTSILDNISIKNYINDLKSTKTDAIHQIIKNNQYNSKNLIHILKNLGHLPISFDISCLLHLLDHKHQQVRFWVVKNIGKFTNESYISILKKIACTDISTVVRREAVSSIGRMHTEKAKEVLFEMLLHEDSKIVCQAIRGLLFFKGNTIVDNQLKKLISHDNEIIKSIIHREYYISNIKNEQSSLLHHSEIYPYLKNVVVHSDVIEVLHLLKDDSIHLTFTSPPYYNARDYSIYRSYNTYLYFLKEVFSQIHRITKEGRFLIVNTSPVIIPRVSRMYSSKRYPIPY